MIWFLSILLFLLQPVLSSSSTLVEVDLDNENEKTRICMFLIEQKIKNNSQLIQIIDLQCFSVLSKELCSNSVYYINLKTIIGNDDFYRLLNEVCKCDSDFNNEITLSQKPPKTVYLISFPLSSIQKQMQSYVRLLNQHWIENIPESAKFGLPIFWILIIVLILFFPLYAPKNLLHPQPENRQEESDDDVDNNQNDNINCETGNNENDNVVYETGKTENEIENTENNENNTKIKENNNEMKMDRNNNNNEDNSNEQFSSSGGCVLL